MATKKTSKRTKTTKKTGEALRKEAIREAEANIAAIEAEERGDTATTTAPAAKGKNAKATKPRAAKNATKANTGGKGAKRKATNESKAKKLSGLDAAAQVLAKASEPLAAKAIADKAIALGWKTNGATPHATLYAAMIREIAAKGRDARFKKVERGLFTAGKKG